MGYSLCCLAGGLLSPEFRKTQPGVFNLLFGALRARCSSMAQLPAVHVRLHLPLPLLWAEEPLPAWTAASPSAICRAGVYVSARRWLVGCAARSTGVAAALRAFTAGPFLRAPSLPCSPTGPCCPAGLPHGAHAVRGGGRRPVHVQLHVRAGDGSGTRGD